MIDIQFPPYNFKIKEENNRSYLFDPFRKQWVVLTPEEWVRQNFLQYLVQQLDYPASCIAVEREIIAGGIKRRFDIVVFKEAKPWMMVECKEMEVPLTDAVIKQVLNYNTTMQVAYLVITNGKDTFALSIKKAEPEWLTNLPHYNEEES